MIFVVIIITTIIQFLVNFVITRELLKNVKRPALCVFWIITCLMATTAIYTKFIFMLVR